ncbi:MAG: aminotransferase class V-fold PLP-dependent enzyme [Candidatus Peribacteraceae bacterium]|nr:aminotransferase class V-fold PLP-dependent enzyme [Candidatus Peribacteraceae bacterium]
MSFFSTKKSPASSGNRPSGFEYLSANDCYMDTACQSLRPQPVIDAEMEYYKQYNACGGRAKHKWGQRVDEKVEAARAKLLALSGKSANEYAVAFTLNATYGINLVLQQIPAGGISSIVTSETEHNSVFLPSITWSRRNNVPRKILKRDDNGTLAITGEDLSNALVIVSTLSNIDGRGLPNAKEIAAAVHKGSGLLLIDAAQHIGHDPQGLKGIDFDAAFCSGHKMYAPSCGFIIIRRTLLRRLEPFFIGGGTVSDVHGNDFTLLKGPVDEHSILEPGLQSWAGIVGLNAAIDWLAAVKPMGKSPKAYEEELAAALFSKLKAMPRIHMMNSVPRPVMSFYVDNLDAHKLAIFLSEQQIMCRSGHFCCHHYLEHERKLPPLLRVSLGLHNTASDIERFLSVLGTIVKTF